MTDTTSDERLWAMLAHLAGFLGYLGAGIGQYIVPLVIYLVYKDKSKFVAFHAIQSLYFQLLLLVGWVVVGGMAITVILLLPAILLAVVIGIVTIVFPILGAIRANAGEWYELPMVGGWARNTIGG
ncbi:MAG: DUF4870 domain-containing protein [Fimbriimonadia bacterium]|nr:DUF4870 domain-containing protein [Fimbriimonadia bacterium]